MFSFHGDAKLKSDLIAEMKKHQEADDFVRGKYNLEGEDGRFKGCSVGCSIQSLATLGKGRFNYSDHKSLGDTIGAPEWLMRLQDSIFEGLPEEESKEFPVRFYEAIPVGVDLEPTRWRFCAFIMRENIEMVLLLDISSEIKDRVVAAIRGVLSVHEAAIETGVWNSSAARAARSAAEPAWATWSAAESARAARAAWATWSAAESAARAARSAAEPAWATWSAAESTWAARAAAESARAAAESPWAAAESTWAARAAAESAWAARAAAESAWAAAYVRYADELIRILKEAK